MDRAKDITNGNNSFKGIDQKLINKLGDSFTICYLKS